MNKLSNYRLGYLRGYADGRERREYESFDDRASYTKEYEYGYSVGYEDGIYNETPEYRGEVL